MKDLDRTQVLNGGTTREQVRFWIGPPGPAEPDTWDPTQLRWTPKNSPYQLTTFLAFH